MRGFILVGLCGLVLSCASDRMGTRLAAWQGSHYAEVTANWGQPVECAAIDTLRVCKWDIRPTATDTWSRPVESRACQAMLAFDDEGVVTGWRWRGQRCQQSATAIVAYHDRDRPDALSLDAEDEQASDLAVTDSPRR